MPCSPGSRVRSGLPHLAKTCESPPGWAGYHLRESLTVATTARTTRFCRTHGPLVRSIISRRCRRCRKNTGETNLTAPLVGTKFWAHGEQSALPALLAPDAAASTATRLAKRDDTRS